MKVWAGSGRWRRLLPVFLCGAKVDGGIKEIGLCGENWKLIGVELCNYGRGIEAVKDMLCKWKLRNRRMT